VNWGGIVWDEQLEREYQRQRREDSFGGFVWPEPQAERRVAFDAIRPAGMSLERALEIAIAVAERGATLTTEERA